VAPMNLAGAHDPWACAVWRVRVIHVWPEPGRGSGGRGGHHLREVVLASRKCPTVDLCRWVFSNIAHSFLGTGRDRGA